MRLQSKPQLSVVFPCYNESGNLPKLIKGLDALIEDKPIQVILVNNGSTDLSKDVFEHELARCRNRLQFTYLAIDKNVGYGHGIRSGLACAEADVLAYTHADHQTDPADLLRAFDLFQVKLSESAGRDNFIVKGKRQGRKRNEWLFSKGLDSVASLVLRASLRDINGQPKMFSRSFYEACLVNGPDDLSLDVYLMAAAVRSKRQIHTFPVYFRERTYGKSSWNTTIFSKLKTVQRFLLTIFSVRARLNQATSP